MEYHRSVAAQLITPSHSLNETFQDVGLDEKYQERTNHLQQLINDMKITHSRLLLCIEHWSHFRSNMDKVENWLKDAEGMLQHFLAKVNNEKLNQEECMQYWVSFRSITLTSHT